MVIPPVCSHDSLCMCVICCAFCISCQQFFSPSFHMGKVKSRPSQAEKKRITDEKNAAKDKERKQCMAAVREKFKEQLAPSWLVEASTGFKDLVAELESGKNDCESLLESCRYHEQRCSQIIGRMNKGDLKPNSADGLRELLEYALELLRDADGNVDAIDAMDDESVYDDLVEAVESTVSEQQDVTDDCEPQDVIEALRALDFAETKEELCIALAAAKPNSGDEKLSSAFKAATEKIERIYDAQAIDERMADSGHKDLSLHTEHTTDRRNALHVTVVKEAAILEENGEDGRIVYNHSTHCKGLLPVLRRIHRNTTFVKTSVPGKLHQVTGNVPAFTMRVQRLGAGDAVGAVVRERVKCVARNGNTAQDVELILWPGLDVEIEAMQQAIDDAIDPPRKESVSSYEVDLREGVGRLNLSGAEILKQCTEKAHELGKVAHEKAKAAQRAKDKDKFVKEKERKLQSSAAAREGGISIKAHAKQWADAESGDTLQGKYWGGGRSKREGLNV